MRACFKLCTTNEEAVAARESAITENFSGEVEDSGEGRWTVDAAVEEQGYIWSINNVVWNNDVPPLMVSEGERVELVIANQTMMSHPMYLHGHSFQVVAINSNRFAGALRDTVLVPLKTTVTVAFDADNPGWWAFHCHLLYHQDAGMFQTVRYE